MAYQCRLCRKHCGNPQGRGVHEIHCAENKGAKIVGVGNERHFVQSDGQIVAAPNMTSKPPSSAQVVGGGKTMRARAEEKAQALASMMSNEPMQVKDIHALYCKLVQKNNLSSTVTSGFLRLHPQAFKCVSRGMYQSLVTGQTGGATALAHPSEKAPAVVEELPQLTAAEQYAIDSDASHRAMQVLQKASALLQFSVLMEDVGAPQALAMVAGMSKLGKQLNRR